MGGVDNGYIRSAYGNVKIIAVYPGQGTGDKICVTEDRRVWRAACLPEQETGIIFGKKQDLCIRKLLNYKEV